jgi:DNA mismatch endonuclease (patch repair protein)
LMSRIRSKGNKKTEDRLRVALQLHKMRGWRRHTALPGTPDFVFPAARLAIFVDGCFWHGCPKHFRPPGRNAQFWLAKISANKRRDRRVDRELKDKGWRVVRIWEHQLTRKESIRTLRRLHKLAFPGECLPESLALRTR